MPLMNCLCDTSGTYPANPQCPVHGSGDQTETTEAALQRIARECAEVNAKYSALLADVDRECKAIESRRGHHHSGTPAERLRYLLADLHLTECDAIAGCKHFRDDCVNWLRAISIVVESIGNAGTHREKEARCRGAVEVIESAIRKLRDREFDRHSWRFWMDDVFRSDYPTREFVRRIHDLEQELKVLKSDRKTEETP